MHKKGCLSVCLFALSPPEEKKRGDKAESWREALTCRGGRGERNETDFDRREKEEGKTHKEKKNMWKSRPVTTVQQACIGVSVISHTATFKNKSCRFVQKPSVYTAATFFFLPD